MIELILAMVFAALLGATGQIVLKLGTNQQEFIKMLPYLGGFAVLYGIAVLINIWVYRAGGKVSVLYPVISLSYIFAAILAWRFLKEPISGYTLAGTLVIVAGIALIGLGSK